MVLQNSNNQSFSVNGDGWSLGAGVSTRTLTLAGADFSLLLSSVGSGDLVQFNGTHWVNVPGTSVGTGSVTSVATGTGLTGGPITNSGTISIAVNGVSNALFRQSAASSIVGNPTGSPANVTDITLGTGLVFSGSTLRLGTSGVTAGTYGNGSNYTTFTVDALGRLTAAGTVALGSMAFQDSNNVNITGGTITGMPTPTAPSDVATKQYVDNVASGIDAKQSVVVATTGSDITLDNTTTTLDGVTLTDGMRILVKDQTDPTQNGIYIASTSGAWTRSTDMATGENAEANFVFVAEGSTLAGHGYVVYNSPAIIDTDPVLWTQFSEVGAYGAAVNGGLSLGSGTPSDFSINFTNILSAGPLGTSNLIAISQNGTDVVKTTIGSLAAEIAGASIFGTGAIHVSSGTVSLVTDGEFAQTGGTLSLGAITPTSINTSGSVSTGPLTSTTGSFTSNVNINGTVSASNLTGSNTGDQTITLTGDVTGSGTGSFATTLSTTGVTAGTYGDSTHPAIVTVDAKGRITSASTGTIALGTGSVTSVAVVGSNGIGVGGSPITNAGTITLTLGTITPLAVNAVGNVTGANISGTNTGDQTITLSGDVTTGPMTNGTFAATLANVVSAGTYSQVVVNSKGLVVSGTNADLSWVDVTSTSQALVPNTGYMTDNVAEITLTLPVTANFGDIIPIVGFGAGGWVLAQNAGQIVHFGNKSTTSGTSGSLEANNRFDSIEIFCAVANTEFVIRNSVGNISVN